jgi:hypothetical protein
MFVISVVASGIKLGLMEFVSLRCSDVMASGIKLGRC